MENIDKENEEYLDEETKKICRSSKTFSLLINNMISQIRELISEYDNFDFRLEYQETEIRHSKEWKINMIIEAPSDADKYNVFNSIGMVLDNRIENISNDYNEGRINKWAERLGLEVELDE